MPLHYEHRITREMLRLAPETLWVFGDNLAGVGFKGQAAEMRGEPNAVGIPTKIRPARAASAYFTDRDVDTFWTTARPRLMRLRKHLEAGGRVVWPADGIGTGLADLPRRAPRIWEILERARTSLEATKFNPA